MRKLLFVPAVALLVAGCSDSTEPSVATTITFSPGSATLDAIGATQVVHATVANQRGKPMEGAELTWSSSVPAVSVTPLGGDSARVTSIANGVAAVTAQSGSATGTLEVRVEQIPVTVDKFGDTQSSTVESLLPTPLRVKLRDRLDVPVAGRTVNFVVTSGGGTLSATSAVTDAEGIAAVTLKLGPELGANSVTATLPGTTLGTVVFTAQATTRINGSMVVLSGGFQAGMAGAVLTPAPVLVVRDAGGSPLSGITVNFTVTSGGGSVSPATAVTNANGQVTVAGWRLGNEDNNTLSATAPGVIGASASVRGIGCFNGGGTGYALTLCITTPMTPSQRMAFQSAAARWGGIVTADLPDVSFPVKQNQCGDGTPSADFVYDDLVIFAGAPAIDGPGQVLGQAGPCFIRAERGLPVVGTMSFDVADLATLENRGQLRDVILHEMGHVLGIGSLWNFYGLLQNLSTDETTLDTYYTGEGGRAGFDAVGGATYTLGQKVPVENSFGPGTRNAHWRESVLVNELMTGFLNSGTNPLSILTVRSLADMGYTVDTSKADNFFLTLLLRSETRTGTGAGPLRLHNDLYQGPQYTVTRRGQIARVR